MSLNCSNASTRLREEDHNLGSFPSSAYIDAY